jgi:YVTN family beta-propeller protein
MNFLSDLVKREPMPLIYPRVQPFHSGENTYTNVLLIDHSVPDYQTFVDSVNSSTFPIVYSTTSSKTELLDLLKSEHFTSISRIGIAFTSNLGNTKMFLDNKPLFIESDLEPFSENVQFLIDVIKEFNVTNIDFLACNTLNYPNWTSYYKLLTLSTGVIVGASDDQTGNMKYGGDWTMESTGQDIEEIYFTKSIEYYSYLLDDPTAIAVGFYPVYMVLNSSTNRLYVANSASNSVSVINTEDNTIVLIGTATAIAVGASPYYIALNSSTNRLYVANYDGNSVSVINTETNTIVGTAIAVGSFPINMVLNSSTNRLYVANYGGNSVSVITLTPTPIPCFKSDSKILTDKGYIPIQDLRKGDFVKTLLNDYKPIVMIGKRDIYHIASKERIKDQLYKCSQTEYPEVFEDLILTGCHSILVDGFTSDKQRAKVIEVNGDTYVTDNKYRLPACADEKASVYEIPGSYTIYHLALENDNYYWNYGIYANGLLVETCSKRYLKELSNMSLIE